MTTTTDTTTTLEDRRAAVLALHAASAADDWETVLAGFHPDVVWENDPGAGPWAGRFEGVDAIATMFTEYLAFLEGTFTSEVLDVCVSPERSASLVVERATKAGHVFENRAVWIWRFEDDLIVEVTTVDLDRDQALAFWASVTP